MKINHIKNILILSFILLSIFLLSYDDHFNLVMNKNYMNYLILLIIVYCIFAEIPLIIILIILLVFIFNNDEFYNKYIQKNKYLKNYIPLRKKNIESYKNNKEKDELDNFEIQPYDMNLNNKEIIENNKEENIQETSIQLDEELIKNNQENIKLEIKKELKEPFKNDIAELRNKLNTIISQN